MSFRALRRFTVLAPLLLLGCPSMPAPEDAPGGADTPGLDAPGLDAPDPSGSDARLDTPPLDAPGLDAGDGGMPSGPTVTICPGDALPSLPSAACEATAGSASVLITADILTPGEVLRGGQVLVDDTGHIRCVGCDCSAGAAGATTITCPDAVLSPGLINAHEHLTFQGQPYTDTGERYEHRHDWRRGLRGHTAIRSSGGASGAAMQWAELRFVMGGATAINGSGAAAGLLRNLDRASDMEGLGEPAVDYDTFPLGDSSGTLLTSGCGYGTINTTAAIASLDAYTPHLSEGIDLAARNEFTCVRMGATDLIEPQTALIHGVGLAISDIFAVRDGGSMLVWSPRSNVTLYGDTARAPEYHRLGVPIALGTDWIYTGSMNMLRELTCADELNTDYFDGYFTDEDLWLMATLNGAMATGTDDVIGRIAVDRVADLALFDARTNLDHRAVIDAGATDVVLVLRGGRPLYGDAAVVGSLSGGDACDTFDVCGAARRACISAETGSSYAALAAANASAYPLFACDLPANEPSCHPERNAVSPLPSPIVGGSNRYDGLLTASDADGDGIANDMDLCPAVFDPIRPMDEGAQPDFDGDGEGDACDPCPFDATSACRLPTGADADADGIADTADNCPGAFNPGQEDGDGDGTGDACDACPSFPNPAGAACPATIYAIKNGSIPVGQAVAVTGAVVTARIGNGFFMQVPPSSSEYAGADFSGVFVFTSTPPTVTAGDVVDVSGRVQDFFGQTQISATTVTVTGSGTTLPAAVVAPAADLATGGSRARVLEGVLVSANDLTVTAVNTMFNEFTVTGSLIVDDAAFLAAPFPAVGARFLSITGVLAFRNSASKLLPRSAADLAGALLGDFGPALSFLDVGATAATTAPTALTVTLSRPAATSTFVAIASGTPSALTVASGGVTIPAGSSSAPVLLNGLAAAAAVTLTASLEGSTRSATVRVVGAGEVPSIASLSPASAIVVPGGGAMFTVTLDLPARTGGANVALALSPAGAGTLPASVTVPAGQLTATFALSAASADATLTATLGASTARASIAVSAGTGGLVINELDYDQLDTDTGEFIELYNAGSSTVSLANVALVLVNGVGGAEYLRIDLSGAGTLAPGAFLVVANAAVTLPAGVARLPLANNTVQNGAPDGVLLLDTSTGTVIDALSYEGSITAATLMGVTGTRSLVEGTPLATSAADNNATPASLCRLPDGTDTNDAASDWAITTTPSPGAPNVP